METICLMEWNQQGINNKKDDLLNLVDIHKPLAIELQETQLHDSNFSLPRYNLYNREGHYNRKPHGGAAILIHQDIPHIAVNLTSNIQAIAFRINIGHYYITICSVYLSRNHALQESELNNLIGQLPTPLIMLGDFNSYNTLWGSKTSDRRGRIIEEF